MSFTYYSLITNHGSLFMHIPLFEKRLGTLPYPRGKPIFLPNLKLLYYYV